jgi:hypothetical protein
LHPNPQARFSLGIVMNVHVQDQLPFWKRYFEAQAKGETWARSTPSHRITQSGRGGERKGVTVKIIAPTEAVQQRALSKSRKRSRMEGRGKILKKTRKVSPIKKAKIKKVLKRFKKPRNQNEVTSKKRNRRVNISVKNKKRKDIFSKKYGYK